MIRKMSGPMARARRAKAAKRQRLYIGACRVVDVRDAQCRACGDAFSSLHHHHLKPRSLGRDDSTSNLLLLCRGCHEDVHAKKMTIVGMDANGELQFRRVS